MSTVKADTTKLKDTANTINTGTTSNVLDKTMIISKGVSAEKIADIDYIIFKCETKNTSIMSDISVFVNKYADTLNELDQQMADDLKE